MAEVSRTARVIQNAKVALFFYCINLILQFFSRKIFLDYLGAELLGLNTTAQNLLQFLNIAESGIGAAVAFTLYKPISQGNRDEINKILSVQGWFYRCVGFVVLLGSAILMLFFPLIFAKSQIPLVFAYGTYIAFLISALLGYFINYNIVLLSADQKEYQITIPTQGVRTVKGVLQIYVVWQFSNGYVWWLGVEVLAAFLTSLILLKVMKSTYPWLKPNLMLGRELRKDYSFLSTKIKQLFFHRIAGYVLTQTTPLVIFAFSTLTTVAIYGNYWVIMVGCLVFMEAMSRGFTASVGNLVAEGNKEKIKKVFWEISTFRLFLAAGVCYGIVFLSDSFVSIWVGPNFIMQHEAMFVMTAVYFIQMQRTSDMFLYAYGLFSDIWAPVVESFLNISLSILLGYFWGLTGIFVGVLISQIVIANSWKATFLYVKGFKESVVEYATKYTIKITLLVLIYFLISLIFDTSNFEIETLLDWVRCAVYFVALYVMLGGLVFYIADSSFRSLIGRFFKIINFKILKS